MPLSPENKAKLWQSDKGWREDRKEAAKKQEAVYEKRPELSITEYADYLSRPGYGVKKKCDMEPILGAALSGYDGQQQALLAAALVCTGGEAL